MKNTFYFVLVFVLCYFCSSVSNAQTPFYISYQGVLTETSGKDTIAPGKYKMTFEIYDAEKNGTRLFIEEHPAVEVQGGLYSIYLGSGTLTGGTQLKDLAFDKPYYLQVGFAPTAASGTFTFNDRLPFASSPYALNAHRIAGKVVDAKAPNLNQVLKYDGQKWTPQEDLTGIPPSIVGDSGIVITTGTNTIRITGVNIKANSPVEITSSNGILTIGLNKIPLTMFDGGNAQKGQTLKWNGTAWAPAFDMPIGTVVAFAGEDVQLPDGWLYCDGAPLNRTEYTSLYDVIGWTYGKPNSQQFNLPDYRGMFLRGIDTSYSQKSTSGRDPDRFSRTDPTNATPIGNRVGSMQGDAFEAHSHDLTLSRKGSAGEAGTTEVAWAGNTGSQSYLTLKYADYVAYKGGIAKSGGSTETHPKNVYVNYIIKSK